MVNHPGLTETENFTGIQNFWAKTAMALFDPGTIPLS